MNSVDFANSPAQTDSEEVDTVATIDVYVVVEGDSVLDVFDSLDEAERMTNSYYDAVVEGPFPLNRLQLADT
jgi:hypothetical protein